jgi:tetratricopeptide (TPR) repeat protein
MQYSKKPLGVDVTWSRVHELLGDAYFQLGQFMMAADAYEAALQHNPYHPWEISLHYRIAQSYYQQNDYAQAIAAVNRLIAAATAEDEQVADYRVHEILGNAQFALGQYADAVISYQRALDLAPAKAEGVDKIRQYFQFAQELC